MSLTLKVGDQAPDFKLKNQNDEWISLESLSKKKTILFFYPKDNTPGCTAEACSLRDNFTTLQDAGYHIYGISPDSIKKHQNFINKFEFPFDLLADTDHEMLEAYGVWGLKKFMGKEYMGVLRTTFVIDEMGKITHIISKVKTKNHAEQIMELVGVD